MANKYRILVVDDEEDLCEILQFNLESEGYDVDTVHSAEEALKLLERGENSHSLILLDVMMGGMSGFKMAAKIRGELLNTTPIIFLTARDTENDMLTGFSLGADDYISKPFSLKEVTARVKAVIRRSEAKEINSVQKQEEDYIKIDDLKIDPENKEVYIEDQKIILTRKEFEILRLLTSSPNRVFSREEILNKVWGQGQIVGDRTVDVHITRLRKKLLSYGNKITNRSNYGYRYEL